MFPLDASAYALENVVGASAASVVYRARCNSNGATICIKQIDLEKTPYDVQAIHRHTAFWSKSGNPHIVKYFGSFAAGSAVWILTEYMGGGSLSELIKFGYVNGIRDEPLIATVLHSVLKALEFLHDHHEIHRDVRASNILVNENGECKLADFGLATSLVRGGVRLAGTMSVYGETCYMAPEVLKSENGYSEKSDVYSFGMIAYQVVTNMPPWDIEIGSSEIVEMVTAGKRPSFKSTVSPAATKMIKGCWGANPEERSSIDDVIGQLLDMTFLPDTDIARIEEYVKRVLPHHRLKNVDSASSARSVSVSTQKSISATELEGSTPADIETLIENANTGSAKAQVEYGRMLQSGARLEKNEKEAARYYEMAARQGDARGECSLGICYYHGVGVAQSYKLAVKYLKRASDKGNKEAQYYMGMCMKDGTGVEKNTKSAIKYFKAAAMQGEVASLRHLKELGVSV